VLVRAGQRLLELELPMASPSAELMKRVKKVPDLERACAGQDLVPGMEQADILDGTGEFPSI
jgi:hypothetical protein